jgi:hypothetical protein
MVVIALTLAATIQGGAISEHLANPSYCSIRQVKRDGLCARESVAAPNKVETPRTWIGDQRWGD